MLCQRATELDGRVLVVAHRKELLQQNAEKISALAEEEVGYYSAGLKSRDTDHRLIAAGIQSIFRDPAKMGVRNLIIVDEAHLISNDVQSQTMYQQLLAAYPEARIVGLTATPYRTGEGPIAGPDRTFTKISYEARVSALTEAGYLSPLTRTPTSTVDIKRVGVRGGEFIAGQMERAFNEDGVVEAACEEVAKLTADRRSVLIFCCGVKHSYHVQEVMEELTGEEVGCVTGDTGSLERSSMLHRFGTGELRYMVNCDVLTTGFDSPGIDAVCVLRSTMSPGLFVQMVGRGFRIHEGKQDCLLLDFGGNRKRHGDPDRDDFGYMVEDRDSDGPAVPAANTRGRLCVNCEGDIPPDMRICPHCHFEPEDKTRREANHEAEADLEMLESYITWEVEAVDYDKHIKRGADDTAPPTMRVTYHVRETGAEGNLSMQVCREWICFEHKGFAKKKAATWWYSRSQHPMPDTVDESLDMIRRHAIRAPYQITTKKEGKWRRVEAIEFKDECPEIVDLQPPEMIPEGAGWSDDYVPF